MCPSKSAAGMHNIDQVLIIALSGSLVPVKRMEGTVWGGSVGDPDRDAWAVCLQGPDDDCVLGCRDYSWSREGEVVAGPGIMLWWVEWDFGFRRY
ncbi:hypothetical protein L1987_00950 [Smallanthus sonchifolius]|uniref:Uncharacterized protein n=1 Tax=Smallanthus sonchifolius TaxID=185202 RepID=A0ACB9K3J6_9ASTR|nr:hypothetical protein L1987_00950 [Smallanthus sonchifolius]